ncbi:MAG: hypothetical protein M3R16_12120 [Pseudomonadota bacterium]|nr:hypothetical protein [Pseudomonadota bacterium]
MTTPLPRIGQSLVQGDRTSVPFYKWFEDVNRALAAGGLSDDEAAALISAIATKLGSPDGTVANIPKLSNEQLDVLAGSGISITGDNPTFISLRTLEDSGVGAALVKITRDPTGRILGTSAATTTDLAEGANLYFTNVRARAASIQLERVAVGSLGADRLVRSVSAIGVAYVSASVATQGDDTIGITSTSAVDGAPILVQTAGSIVMAGWAWTPGMPVYAADAGLLTQTPPTTGFSQAIGHAESATSIFIHVQPAIYL